MREMLGQDRANGDLTDSDQIGQVTGASARSVSDIETVFFDFPLKGEEKYDILFLNDSDSVKSTLLYSELSCRQRL